MDLKRGNDGFPTFLELLCYLRFKISLDLVYQNSNSTK